VTAASEQLDYDGAVQWLTARAGQAVWISIDQKQVGTLVTFAVVLQIPVGIGWKRITGAPVDLDPDRFLTASTREHGGEERAQLRLRFRGGVDVVVWRRVERQHFEGGGIVMVDPSPRDDG